jgi:hypothetical protein
VLPVQSSVQDTYNLDSNQVRDVPQPSYVAVESKEQARQETQSLARDRGEVQFLREQESERGAEAERKRDEAPFWKGEKVGEAFSVRELSNDFNLAGRKQATSDSRIKWAAPSEYVVPDTSAAAERVSFRRQVKTTNGTDIRASDPARARLIADVVRGLYRRCTWKVPHGWWTDMYIAGKIHGVLRMEQKSELTAKMHQVQWKINKDGSPGWPYLKVAQTNAEFVELMGLPAVTKLVRDRIKTMLETGKVIRDAVRIFIKQEPHKREKRAEGRWRLIWSVSLIDQIIDSILFDPYLEAEVMRPFSHPSFVTGFARKGVATRVCSFLDPTNVAAMERQLGSIDYKGWDISFSKAESEMYRDHVLSLCANSDEAECRAADFVKLIHLAIEGLFESDVLVGGALLKQEKAGIIAVGRRSRFPRTGSSTHMCGFVRGRIRTNAALSH